MMSGSIQVSLRKVTSVTTNIIAGTAARHQQAVPDVILTVTVHSASL